MRADLAETILAKRNYLRDLNVAKQTLVGSACCPPAPDAIWKDVLANRFVDLDKIFASLHITAVEPRKTVKLGDYELTPSTAKPAVHILSQGNWISAWMRYIDAVAFVYPHCRPELQTYFTYICNLFNALGEGQAKDVIEFDKACRAYAAQVNHIALDEPNNFTHLHIQYFIAGGEASKPFEGSKGFNRGGDGCLPSVIGGMKTVASVLNVPSATTALNVEHEDIQRPVAPIHPKPILESLKPRRFRGFLWDSHSSFVTPLADLSETLRPLPRPPLSEFMNETAMKTIRENPHLFKVITPINVDRFESLLRDHPNRALVDSVCAGLREGFWPFAESDLTFPETVEMDNSVMTESEERYIRDYIAEEVAEERYSPAFGPTLLPGMYSMPVYTIPKANSSKLRLINNHLTGPFSVNALIDKSKIGMHPDNI